MRKLLLDPEIRQLDIEEQISYFLFSYRNICLDNKCQFPSERLLSHKPKTMLDLINPRSNFKNNLTNSHDGPSLVNADVDEKPDAFTKIKNGDDQEWRSELLEEF